MLGHDLDTGQPTGPVPCTPAVQGFAPNKAQGESSRKSVPPPPLFGHFSEGFYMSLHFYSPPSASCVFDWNKIFVQGYKWLCSVFKCSEFTHLSKVINVSLEVQVDHLLDGTVGGKNPANQLRFVVSFSHYLQGFLHPRWRSPDFWTINSISVKTAFLSKGRDYTFDGLSLDIQTHGEDRYESTPIHISWGEKAILGFKTHTCKHQVGYDSTRRFIMGI